MKRRRGEPPAPTPLDEALSRASLRSSPWIKQRLKELGIRGKQVTTWFPPFIETRCLPQNERPWS